MKFFVQVPLFLLVAVSFAVRAQSLIGKKAPAVIGQAMIEGDVQTVDVSSYAGYKVVFFYPLDFTFVCPTELHALQDKMEDFNALNTTVFAVSVDSPYCHGAWLETLKDDGGIYGVAYPIISDINKSIAHSFGILDEDQGIALRATFILDEDNVVQFSIVHNLSVGRNIDEIIRLIKACQLIKSRGTTCPANWVPGDADLVPTHEGVVDYFAQ